MLLIDSGNSAIKCRLMQQGEAIDRRFSLNELVALASYLASVSTPTVVLACVSGKDICQRIRSLCQSHLPVAEFSELKSLPRLNGLVNGYQDYTQLGVDRWLTMVALTPLQHDAIIVDAGSAITIDLLSGSNGHLGGAILPGLNTSLNRFRSVFAQLMLQQKSTAKIKRPGRDTFSCIDLSEAPYSVAGVVSILQQWRPLLQSTCDILISGQDAGLISEQLELPHRVVPDLVFTGMLKQFELLG